MYFRRVARILAEIINVDDEDITPQTEFTSDYQIERLDLAKLIIECEKKFRITIHDEDVHRFKTVKDIADYIEEILSGM